MYPQFSAATNATVVDDAARALMDMRWQPALRTLPPYYDNPDHIAAVAQSVREGLAGLDFTPDLIVTSFHGMPLRTLEAGDPYHCQCRKTGRLLQEALGMPVQVTFQSRFGRAEWLKPYTTDVIKELAKKKVGRIDVVCPGFVSDCLETLEEIAIEAKGDFLTHGGKELHYIPCLNERDDWLHALTDITLNNLQGWNSAATPESLKASKDRAVSLGAKH
jgi:ferrochelatase